MSEEVIYYYRGLIERGTGKGYAWREGYSANSDAGLVLYPWNTKRECKERQRMDGKKAVFIVQVRRA